MPIDSTDAPRYAVADLNGRVLDPYTDDKGAAIAQARQHAYMTSTPTHVYQWVKRAGSFERVPVWRSEVDGRARTPDGRTLSFHS